MAQPGSTRAIVPPSSTVTLKSSWNRIMKLPRRQFLRLAAGAATAAAHVAACAGASLSVAAGARNCRAGCRQRIRHNRPSNWSIFYRSVSVSNSSSRTGQARAETSPPKRSCVHRRTAIRFSWSIHRTPSTRRSTTNSISISSATSRRSAIALISCRRKVDNGSKLTEAAEADRTCISVAPRNPTSIRGTGFQCNVPFPDQRVRNSQSEIIPAAPLFVAPRRTWRDPLADEAESDS
jgi:hypothetical protein